jgi:hypothetical protein
MTTLHAEVRENGLVDSWRVVVVRDHGGGDVVETLVATGLTREASDRAAKHFNDNVAHATAIATEGDAGWSVTGGAVASKGAPR